ncbi:hypothetical protein L208DRAFT_1247667 [Tricholoma matsutake]|nr:hypothetical protein L208DRAFT_1247667 [Tricholoma matsutake 945]
MFLTPALIALPFFVQSALAATCTRSYTVKPGDICDGISAANHVSTYQLAAINPSINPTCSNLMPGSTLCLGYSGEDCTATHVVASDDTCDFITSMHKLNSTILYMNNPQINQACTNIYIGEVLCVASQVQVPSAPAGGYLPGSAIPSTALPAHTAASSSASSADDDLPYCD